MPFKGFKLSPIEILCEGQQFVAFAVHPDTGRPYEWPEDSLAEIDIGALPAITESQARAFAEEAYALVPETLRPAGGCQHVVDEHPKGAVEAGEIDRAGHRRRQRFRRRGGLKRLQKRFRRMPAVHAHIAIENERRIG